MPVSVLSMLRAEHTKENEPHSLLSNGLLSFKEKQTLKKIMLAFRIKWLDDPLGWGLQTLRCRVVPV